MMLPLPQLHVAVRYGTGRPVVIIANRSFAAAQGITVTLRDAASGVGWTRLLGPMATRTLAPHQQMRIEVATSPGRMQSVPVELTLTVRWRDATRNLGCWSGVFHPASA